MKTLKQTTLLFATMIILIACKNNSEKPSPASEIEKETKKVLLIGTFHYNNPGADVAKTKDFDILNSKSQNQLEQIAAKISDFDPSKFFVEWPFDEQKELDSLYNLYLENKYFENDSLSDFYLKNEIFQLAFRASKKIDLGQPIAIDYRNTEFPFDSLMTVIGTAKQSNLQTEIVNGIQFFTTEFDNRISNGVSLLDLTYFLNSDDMRKKSNRIHTEVPLLAGEKENFIGPYLASEWHRRNLSMWSLVQKSLDANDEKIVLLLGASHIAMIKEYIDSNEDWEAVELKEIIK